MCMVSDIFRVSRFFHKLYIWTLLGEWPYDILTRKPQVLPASYTNTLQFATEADIYTLISVN